MVAVVPLFQSRRNTATSNVEAALSRSMTHRSRTNTEFQQEFLSRVNSARAVFAATGWQLPSQIFMDRRGRAFVETFCPDFALANQETRIFGMRVHWADLMSAPCVLANDRGDVVRVEVEPLIDEYERETVRQMDRLVMDDPYAPVNPETAAQTRANVESFMYAEAFTAQCPHCGSRRLYRLRDQTRSVGRTGLFQCQECSQMWERVESFSRHETTLPDSFDPVAEQQRLQAIDERNSYVSAQEAASYFEHRDQQEVFQTHEELRAYRDLLIRNLHEEEARAAVITPSQDAANNRSNTIPYIAGAVQMVQNSIFENDLSARATPSAAYAEQRVQQFAEAAQAAGARIQEFGDALRQLWTKGLITESQMLKALQVQLDLECDASHLEQPITAKRKISLNEDV
jgi:DNA-directed RNA polymerase subunit M/transcription elongation factor TFIIS